MLSEPANPEKKTTTVPEALSGVVDADANANSDTEFESDAELQSRKQKFNLPLVVTLSGAAFLNTLSVQSAVIILPTIGRHLNIPAERQQWIISAYYLTFGCFLLLWGRLADIYGRRLIFIYGSAWVAVVTIALPFSQNEITFDLLRGLQGLGAAANVPTAVGILGATFSPGKAKNYAFSIYAAGSSLGSVLGNLFAGVIGEYADWRWIFWIIGILAAITSLAGHFLIPLPTVQEEATRRFQKVYVDWIGGAIITVGLIVLTFALTQGNVVGWTTPWVPSLIVISVLLVAIFVLWQWYLENKTDKAPLMRVSIWHNKRFAAAQVIISLFFASFNNYLTFVTYFYQDYLGLSIIQTTLRFIPTGVLGLIANFLAAILLPLVPGSILLIFATTCISTSTLLFAIPISPETTYWAYGFPAMCLCTLGADILLPTIMLFTAQSLPDEDQALGGGLTSSMLQIGRALGLAIATAVQTTVEDGLGGVIVADEVGSEALLTGLRAAEWFNFGLGVAALGLVLCAFRGTERVGAAKRT